MLTRHGPRLRVRPTSFTTTSTMHIKKIKSQLRRDLFCIYECEHCGHTMDGSGYDDANFHRNVVPAMRCPQCNKTADAEAFHPLGTKYTADEVV